MAKLEEKEFQQRVQRIEGLVRKIESMSDPNARDSARELVQSLMDLHGAGLERMLEIAWEQGDAGRAIIDELGRDELVGSLLLLYGLHPLNLETRVSAALEKVRPYLRSHGGNVQLVSVADGVVRLRLEGSGQGCVSSAQTMKLAIEEAIYEAAPDVAGIQVEGAIEQPRQSGFVQLQGRNAGSSPAP